MDVLKGICRITEDAKPHGCGSSSSYTPQLFSTSAQAKKFN
ncbi:hypothetical protein LEAN103870_06110 [Legionella anisa]|nr:hypothetical protein [Legionella anisa]MCW8424204.1 hypothetical protein [Legionella anisa]MCW8446678.1 hypothetical protein [Legionella anisa]